MEQHWVAIYIDANSRGEYYDPSGTPPFLMDYVNFMNKHCTSWSYNTVRVQEEGSTVCVHHCIFTSFIDVQLELASMYIATQCCSIRWSGSVFPTRAEGTLNSLGNLLLA
jgi:hypothetical protein